jgi:hypothetical protein
MLRASLHASNVLRLGSMHVSERLAFHPAGCLTGKRTLGNAATLFPCQQYADKAMGFLAGKLEPLGLSVKQIRVERVSKRVDKFLGICPNFENVPRKQ